MLPQLLIPHCRRFFAAFRRFKLVKAKDRLQQEIRSWHFLISFLLVRGFFEFLTAGGAAGDLKLSENFSGASLLSTFQHLARSVTSLVLLAFIRNIKREKVHFEVSKLFMFNTSETQKKSSKHAG